MANNLKTFNDLVFTSHRYFKGGSKSQIFFDNGYGASVINGQGAYVRGDNEYELAVLFGNEDKNDLCYTTEITDDVIGYLSEDEVTEILIKIQNLK